MHRPLQATNCLRGPSVAAATGARPRGRSAMAAGARPRGAGGGAGGSMTGGDPGHSGLRSSLLSLGVSNPVLALWPAVSATLRAQCWRGCVPVRSRALWPPHVCTKEPAPLHRGANAAKGTAAAAFLSPDWGPRTLRNAEERSRTLLRRGCMSLFVDRLVGFAVAFGLIVGVVGVDETAAARERGGDGVCRCV